MVVLKTVFKEEIKVGDKIMYIYKSSGMMYTCFGEVLEIEYKDIKFHRGKMPHLHVHKTYEIRERTHTKCDKKVILTSPHAFKCNEVLKYPEDEIDTDLIKYEISLLPDFGNEHIIIEAVKKMKIATTGKTRESGFYGSNVPVILDITCTEEDRKKLGAKLDEVCTASCTIMQRCPGCGSIH